MSGAVGEGRIGAADQAIGGMFSTDIGAAYDVVALLWQRGVGALPCAEAEWRRGLGDAVAASRRGLTLGLGTTTLPELRAVMAQLAHASAWLLLGLPDYGDDRAMAALVAYVRDLLGPERQPTRATPAWERFAHIRLLATGLRRLAERCEERAAGRHP
ncbi:hypothetical protein RM574_23580 [Streptomyces sp. DSM 41982]|uniref:Uncharacterized protein n=1 Tax=Streptomyces evansiae TaxID=3075535 RepID=A0ABD5EE22_9ACTN|nr:MULTISPECIES: hypothetical protein [unclassified Streptomyces]EFL02212.1 conserved hypothetical protein [Streptomyces sp. SPB78]MDT0418470.1 hypothetical protein [Streptomyces sp. DSM 41982]SCE29045.1 hypothetical protein GA0115246_113862 [Streptomyces sp. SolWspMP-sol7th]